MKREVTQKEFSLKISLLLSFLAVLVFIYANSFRKGSASAEESQGLFALLARFFSFLPFFTHAFLRKLAHFAEYTLLGIHLFFFPSVFGRGRKRECLSALAAGALVALTDELVQAFVPGRGSSLWDCAIDFGGVLFGHVLVLLCFILKKAISKKEELEGGRKNETNL